MVPLLQNQLVHVSGGLAHPGRGHAKFVAFAPDGVHWFIRYSTNMCIWGPDIEGFSSTFRSLVHELETTHPRKDECIDFVAFGPHDLLLVRYENGNSQMLLPDHPGLRSQISAELIREVEERLQAGWTLGNRTTLCSFDTNRWFLEWKRGSDAVFKYSTGIGQSEDLARVQRVLSGVGNDAAVVANNEAVQLVGPSPFNDRRWLLTVTPRFEQTQLFPGQSIGVGSGRLCTFREDVLFGNEQGYGAGTSYIDPSRIIIS